MSLSVIIHGPQGCGKTQNAQRLAKLFGLQTITDDWMPGNPVVKTGVLYLTCEQPGRHTGAMVIDYTTAMRRINTAADDRKVRRPAVVRLAAQLQRENPTWSEQRLLTEAKLRVTREKKS